ncbi:MAG: hypothetical protein AAGK04_04625 [Planctomycetota bacterium]
MRAGVVLLVYAGLLLLGGMIAFGMAPPGANAMTALIVPGVCAVLIDVCGVLVIVGAARRRRALVMIGAHAGLVLSLLFSVAFAMQGWTRLGQARERAEAVERYEAGELSGAAATDAGLSAFLEAQDLPAHDTMYLAVILLSLAAISVLAFVALVLSRPKPGAA